MPQKAVPDTHHEVLNISGESTRELGAPESNEGINYDKNDYSITNNDDGEIDETYRNGSTESPGKEDERLLPTSNQQKISINVRPLP